MAWLSGYSKRKPITITGGASGAQTDFQIKLTVTYDGDMQSDFDDLRFTQADGQTLIDAWLETKTDDTSATVWAEFPTTPANTVEADYYMYYGKVVASDWDGAATFNFFDDFNRANSSTIGNGWTEDLNAGNGNASIESNMLKLYTPDTGSDSIVRVTRDLTSLGLAQFIIESKMKVTQITSTNNNRNLFGVYDGDGTNSVYIGSGYINGQLTGFANYGSDVSYHDYGSAPSVDTWQKLKLTYDTINEFIPYFNDSAKSALTGRPLYSNPFKLFFYQLTSSPTTGTLTSYYDYTFVHKYAANPPTYAFGAEQSAPTVGVRPPRVFCGPFCGPFGGPIQCI